MNSKIFLPLIFSILLLSTVSATIVVDGYFKNDIYKTEATITSSETITLNAIFSSTGSITSKGITLPSGLSSDAGTCTLSSSGHTYTCTYTITPSNTGIFDITVIGTDYTGSTDSEFLTLTVNPAPTPINNAPVITSSPITNINEGASYNYHVVATDSDGDTLTYSLTSAPAGLSMVPPWLSINSVTGVISGTAPLVSADTDYNVVIGVSDGKGGADTQTYTLTVKNIPCPVNHAPVITSTPITTVDEGDSYNYHVVATDEDGDALTYSLIAPSWLSINSATGIISGTAPAVDSDTDYSIIARVSDGINPTVTQSYTLTVEDTDEEDTTKPVITLLGANPQIITKGDSYHEYKATAWDDEDGDLTDEIIIDSSDVDTDVVGTYFVTYTVEDSSGNEATKTRTVKVVALDDEECNGCDSTRTIEDNPYDKDKYLNQFKPKQIISPDTSVSKTSKFSVLTLFYLILAIIGLGIIIALFWIFNGIRSN